MRRILGAGSGPLPDGLVAEIRMGTTVATNALLERKGLNASEAQTLWNGTLKPRPGQPE